jgi:hypothetical protein
MNILDSLKAVFPPVDTETDLSEKFSTFDVAYRATWADTTPSTAVEDCLRQIPDRDSWSLTAAIDGETIPISSSGDLSKDASVLNASKDSLVGNGEFALKLTIQKGKAEGIVSIYSFSLFERFLDDVGPLSFLESVRTEALNNDVLRFHFLDPTEELNFQTCKFLFGSPSTPRVNAGCRQLVADKSCDFNRRNDLPFYPDNFRLLSRTAESTVAERTLDSLFSLFLVANIFDSVTLNQGQISIRLVGFRVLDWQRDHKTFLLDSAQTYWEIYEWIYAERTKVTDKLGIARNILSTYLKPDSLELDPSAHQAVISGYKVYLKENLSKYLDLRGKIHNELSEISKKASDVINEYFSNYQKSALTFLSFFITVFVVRFFTAAKEDGIFNREATLLTLAFLGVSFLYLVISFFILSREKARLETRYRRLKGRFTDLLHENDIKTILNDDAEYNDEMKFVNARRIWYTVLWLGTIGIILWVVLEMSTYVSWNDIGRRIAAVFRQ